MVSFAGFPSQSQKGRSWILGSYPKLVAGIAAPSFLWVHTFTVNLNKKRFFDQPTETGERLPNTIVMSLGVGQPCRDDAHDIMILI